MVKVEEFSSPVPGMGIAGIAGPVLASRMSVRAFVQAAAASAKQQGLAVTQLERPGMYALLALTEDRRILGLECRAGQWAVVRVPVPTGLIRRLALPSSISRDFPPLWIRLLPDSLGVVRNGKEVAVWDVSLKNPPVPDLSL